MSLPPNLSLVGVPALTAQFLTDRSNMYLRSDVAARFLTSTRPNLHLCRPFPHPTPPTFSPKSPISSLLAA